MDWEVRADEEVTVADMALVHEEMLALDREEEDRVYAEVIIPDYMSALDVSEAA